MENSVAVSGGSNVVDIESQRAIQEVQAACVVAKRFPRNVDSAYIRIMESCKRKSLAEQAQYAYPRGGEMITGPSIRLAEIMAQNWGNLNFGIRELSQHDGVSEMEAFCWDLETNVRQTKTFQVAHTRYSKKAGFTKLADPRDIYEMVANQGARRLRACILGIIPGDITDDAVKRCEETLKSGNIVPLQDRVRSMLEKFLGLGVSQEMIEARIGHKTAAIIEQELLSLGKIFNSLKDGMSKREDWFVMPKTDAATSEETTKFKSKTKKQDAPAPAQNDLERARELFPEVYREVLVRLPAGSTDDQILAEINRLIDES